MGPRFGDAVHDTGYSCCHCRAVGILQATGEALDA